MAVALWLTAALGAASPVGVLSAACEAADPPCAHDSCAAALSPSCCCHPLPAVIVATTPATVAKLSLVPGHDARACQTVTQTSAAFIATRHSGLILPRCHAGPTRDLPILHSTLRI